MFRPASALLLANIQVAEECITCAGATELGNSTDEVADHAIRKADSMTTEVRTLTAPLSITTDQVITSSECVHAGL